MFKKNNVIHSFMLVLALLALEYPGVADAQRRGGRREERREAIERTEVRGRTRMVVSGREYFYGEGRFYRYGPRGYSVVTAPVGARLRVLPAGFATVRLGRLPLFVSFGTYYRFDPVARMYVVVEAPPNAPPPASVPASPGNYDKLNLDSGETVTGTYLGGTPDTISVQVGNEVQAFAVDQIKSIQFAPPQPH